MKASTLAQRNTSEKGRRAAQATKMANADRKADEERKLQAFKSGMKGKAALPGQVPPFCYLASGRSPEEAAAEAFKHFSMTPAEALGLVWKLRRVIASDNASDNAEGGRA